MEERRRATMLEEHLGALVGERCWEVDSRVDSTVSLEFGHKVRIDPPLRLPPPWTDSDNVEGEMNVLVWCDWRLDGPDDAVASSDMAEEERHRAVQVLLDRKVAGVVLTPPAWDLGVEFEGGYTLRVFCEFVSGDPYTKYNWQFGVGELTFSVGPGHRWDVEGEGTPG